MSARSKSSATSALIMRIDRSWIRRAVDAEQRVDIVLVEIERSCTQRIPGTSGHTSGIFRIDFVLCPLFRRRRPCRPFGLALDDGGARARRTLVAHTDAIVNGPPLPQNVLVKALAAVDHDGARRFVTFMIAKSWVILWRFCDSVRPLSITSRDGRQPDVCGAAKRDAVPGREKTPRCSADERRNPGGYSRGLADRP